MTNSRSTNAAEGSSQPCGDRPKPPQSPVIHHEPDRPHPDDGLCPLTSDSVHIGVLSSPPRSSSLNNHHNSFRRYRRLLSRRSYSLERDPDETAMFAANVGYRTPRSYSRVQPTGGSSSATLSPPMSPLTSASGGLLSHMRSKSHSEPAPAYSASSSGTPHVVRVSTSGPRFAPAATTDSQRLRQLQEEIAHKSIELENLESMSAGMKRHTIGAGYNGLAPRSSQVIKDLQMQKDNLKRRLIEQEMIVQQETRFCAALRTKVEHLEGAVDSLKHQNSNLSNSLRRRDHKIMVLEGVVKSRDHDLLVLGEKTQEDMRAHLASEQELRRYRDECSRLEVSYNAIAESSRQVKSKYQEEMAQIGAKVGKLQAQRAEDVQRIKAMQDALTQSQLDSLRVNDLQQEMKLLRDEHIAKLDQMFADIRQAVLFSDTTVAEKFESVATLVEDLRTLAIVPMHRDGIMIRTN